MAPITLRNLDVAAVQFDTTLNEYAPGKYTVRAKPPTLVQFGDDQFDRMQSKWGLDRPHPDAQNQDIRTLALSVTSPGLAKLREVDAHVRRWVADNARMLFKKDKTFEYLPLVKDTDDGPVLKIKVNCGARPTKIKALAEGGKVVDGTWAADLGAGCEALVLASLTGIWFDETRCGVTLATSAILVKPGVDELTPDSFVLAPGLEWA
jgi:hypothetical protein